MVHFMLSLQEARGYDDLLPVLEDLTAEARHAVSAEHASAEKIQVMSTVLFEARLLLNELASREVRSRGTSRHAADRHLEIEGKMKEIGAVLDQAIKRVKP